MPILAPAMGRLSAGHLALAALAAVALLGAAHPVPAPDDDPPPAPRLRPAGGEVMLASDFHHASSLEAWSPDRGGVWSIVHGALRARLPDRKQARSLIYAGSEEWTQYAVDVDVCQTRGVDKGLALRVLHGRGVGVDLRGPGYHDVLLNLQQRPLGRAPVHNDNGIWHHLRVEALDSRYRVLVDGKLVLDRTDPHHSSRQGRIALAAYTGGEGQCTVYYDNVVVTALR
jgi:hypothetical protein